MKISLPLFFKNLKTIPYHFPLNRGARRAKKARTPSRRSSLLNARKIREIADYDIDEEIVEPVVSLKIDEGRASLSVIKNYLGE